MLEQLVRQHYQRSCVDHFAKIIAPYFKPTHITLIGGVTGICIVPLLAFQHYYLAIFLLLISGYCDTLDGTLARHQISSTAFGSVLDILMDRIVEFAVVFGLWLIEPNSRSLMCLLMLGSIFVCVTSFLVVGIFTQNQTEKSFYYSPGIIERAEAFIFFILMILLPNNFYFLSGLFCILVLITTIVRVYEFYKNAVDVEKTVV